MHNQKIIGWRQRKKGWQILRISCAISSLLLACEKENTSPKCRCFCIQHYHAIQNVGGKNSNEKKRSWCTGIMSRMAVESCTNKPKGETRSSKRTDEDYRCTDFEAMCSHQAAIDRVYNQRCFWLYATERKNIQKNLEKEKSKGHRKPNETGNAQNELFEGQKKNAR